MSELEFSVRFALGCAVIAYLALGTWLFKRRTRFPLALLSIPALSLAAWWVADSQHLGPARIGFTFYGALVVALIAGLSVPVLAYGKSFKPSNGIHLGAALFASIVLGAALSVLLPAIPE